MHALSTIHEKLSGIWSAPESLLYEHLEGLHRTDMHNERRSMTPRYPSGQFKNKADTHMNNFAHQLLRVYFQIFGVLRGS